MTRVRLGKINWTLRQFRLDELTDYYKNPRSLSEKRNLSKLKTSLDKFGMMTSRLWNADSANTIIGGISQARLEASGVKELSAGFQTAS
jgi:hypothetical protein